MNKTTLTISKGTRKIGRILAAIEEIIISDSVTSIGNYAFAGCGFLKKITIPNSVISIGYDAFYGCSALKSIYIDKEKGSLDLSKTRIPESCKVYWKGEF